MDQNVRKFLDFLGKAEGADYDTIVGGKLKIQDFSRHPGIVGLRTAEGPSTAAGKYQITKTTYNDFAPRLGITDFSPESQDKIALAIIEQEGALEDIKRGDWNAAINKLGGRWASLPSSRYNQPKRDWEFVQKHLGIGGGEPLELQFQMTQPGSAQPTEGPDAAEIAIADEIRSAQHGGVINQLGNLPEAIQYGFENENAVYNYFVDRGLQQHDPNFEWTVENAKEALKDVPPDARDYILQAGSWAEAMLRRERVFEALKKQKELSDMGLVGTIGTLTGALVDLPTLIGFVPVIGGAAFVSRTSRIANALSSGLASAGSNVVVDAAMLKYRPLASTDELYFSALAGLGFGALGGALTNPAAIAARAASRAAARDLSRAIDQGVDEYVARPILIRDELDALQRYGRREMNIIQREEIEAAGFQLTPRGLRLLDNTRDPDVDAVRVETFNRTMTARRTSAVPGGVEVPIFPSGKPRPAISGRAMLDDLSRSTEDELVGPLAARLKEQLIDDFNIYITPKKNLIGGGRSFYDSTRHAVFLRKDAPDRIKLHEIAHAVTVQKIDYGKMAPDSVHGKLVSQLEDARLEALRAAEGRNLSNEARYYLSNIYEFTAGLYSGRTDFIDFLASIKTSDSNLLSRVVDTIRKLLGFDDKEANLFLKSLNLTDRLVSERLDVNIRRPYVDPDAPPAVSVHMEPMEGVNVDPATVKAVKDAGLNEVFGWSFGLEHKLRKVKNLPGAFKLADKLIGTTVGYKNHAVVGRNAYDQALQLGDSWSVQVRKTTYTQFEDYFKRSGRKFWQRDETAKEWNTQLGDYIRGVEGDYDPSIVKTGDQIRKVLGDVVDHINNPAKATGGTKRGLTQDIYLDEQGNQLLTDPLPKNPNYLPRVNDAQKWDQMVQQFGREFVEDFWAGAFRSANPDVSEEVAARFGRWYVKRVEQGKKNGDQDFLSEQLRGYDKEALKESMLRAGLTENEAQELLDNMFPKTHKGQAALVSNVKQRAAIDETYSVDVTVGGQKSTVTLNDFINTDTIGVLDGYFRRMAGAIALANHVDVYKSSDIGKTILEATTVKLGDTVSPADLQRLRNDFQFTFDRLLHRPVEDFSVWNKSMEMWRNFNVIRLMGAAVYNQIQELSQIIGTMGWKMFLRAIPELRKFTRDLKSGKVANPLLDDLENMVGGAGADLIMRANFNPSEDWVRELGDTTFNRFLDRLDNGLRKFANGTLKYTGMTGVMVQQKRIHAIAFVNHFYDVAHKGKKMGLSKERLAWMGLSDADVNTILNNMRKYAKEKQGVSGGKAGTVDFDAWGDADPESLSKFVTAFQRESRRVVQENDLASATTFMSKTWGKTMFQFLNFVFHAWNKSLLFGMNHRDFQTLSTVMHGTLFAALVYMARTSQQSLGMSEEERREFLERRLDPQQVVFNALGRIPQASLLPNFIDQVSPTPLFSGMRTTSDTSDFFSSNPTMAGINTLFSMWRKGVRNSLSENYQFTEQDVRSYIRLLPLNNVVGISALYGSLAKGLPRNEEVIPTRD